jgi:hypothetical protein
MSTDRGVSPLTLSGVACVLFMVVVVLSPFSQAATASFQATVERTLVADADRWGGCMARTNVTLADLGVDCYSRWVTFSCSGVHTTKDVAYRMFDSAQMAMALDKQVWLSVTDQKKHNGYCFANRIDVLR